VWLRRDESRNVTYLVEGRPVFRERAAGIVAFENGHHGLGYRQLLGSGVHRAGSLFACEAEPLVDIFVLHPHEWLLGFGSWGLVLRFIWSLGVGNFSRPIGLAAWNFHEPISK
jgi:hypothetical protein